LAKKVKGSLCKLKRGEVAKYFPEIKDVVEKPKFICENCARVSSRKKYLCRPIRLSEK
jgi:hypothetical protein